MFTAICEPASIWLADGSLMISLLKIFRQAMESTDGSYNCEVAPSEDSKGYRAFKSCESFDEKFKIFV